MIIWFFIFLNLILNYILCRPVIIRYRVVVASINLPNNMATTFTDIYYIKCALCWVLLWKINTEIQQT